MNFCILCENAFVNEVRLAGKRIMGSNILKIPASENGIKPITHWVCFLTVTEDGKKKLLSLQKKTIMEESTPKEFLKKWNLKIIK